MKGQVLVASGGLAGYDKVRPVHKAACVGLVKAVGDLQLGSICQPGRVQEVQNNGCAQGYGSGNAPTRRDCKDRISGHGAAREGLTVIALLSEAHSPPGQTGYVCKLVSCAVGYLPAVLLGGRAGSLAGGKKSIRTFHQNALAGAPRELAAAAVCECAGFQGIGEGLAAVAGVIGGLHYYAGSGAPGHA
ncbi:MAG: hypothetical protein A4E49_01684 [Methanosaeta sp. PtaU1.Bin112]|nr:MAG: hypothetical protein A4E49_01684 [Methanosaeta sp. PtaU1.Bin112]